MLAYMDSPSASSSARLRSLRRSAQSHTMEGGVSGGKPSDSLIMSVRRLTLPKSNP